MKSILTLIAVAAAVLTTQASDTISLKSDIKAVTVFLEGAQIKRIAKRNFSKGKYSLRIEKLPLELDPKSIQLKSTNGNTILSVKHYVREFKPNDSMSEFELNRKIKRLKLLVEELNSEFSVLSYEESLLLDNDNFKNEKGGVKVEDIMEASRYYRERLSDLRMRKLKLSRKVDSINALANGFQHRVNRINSAPRSSYSEVFLELDAPKAGVDQISLTYYVPSAGWKPYYDFRVDNLINPLSITYLAKVYQSPGENWKNVDITLSNVNPKLKGDRPVMKRWVFGQDPYAMRIPRKSAPTSHTGTTYYSSGGIKGKIIDTETGEALPFVNVVVEQNGLTVTGGTTDFDRVYFIKPLSAGTYVMKVKYVGYKPIMINGVRVQSDKITFQDLRMTTNAMQLEAFEVTQYQVPLIDKDGRSSFRMGDPDLARMGARSVAGTIRGNRNEATFQYIDGIKVRRQGILATNNLISNTLKTTVGNVEYKIEAPYTVMADGHDHSMRIKEVKTDAQYLHYALPKLDLDVFLVAKVAEWNKLKLLSGEFNIF